LAKNDKTAVVGRSTGIPVTKILELSSADPKRSITNPPGLVKSSHDENHLTAKGTQDSKHR
jgi:hypothetical protein